MESITWSKETKVYTGIGAYTFSFPAYYKRQILVQLEDLTTGTISTLRLYEDYDIVFNTVAYGGTVNLLKTQNSGNLIIARDMRLEQNIDYRFGNKIYLPGLEAKADSEIRIIQQVMRRYEEVIASPWWRGLWVANRQYKVGELISYTDSKLYIINTDHISGAFATDLAAGRLDLFFSGANIASYLPGISGGDAKKMLRSNLAETALEHGLAVGLPSGSNIGKIPTVLTADAIYDAKHFQKMPHPRFRFKTATDGRVYFSGWAEYDYHGWGSYYGDYTEQWYYFNNLAASTWVFLYFDGSDSPYNRRIQYDWQIYDATEVPAYDKAKGGWYNAAGDLCIFMVYGISGSNYRQFYHSGDQNVWWLDSVQEYSNAAFPVTTWTPISLTYTPSICSEALLNCLFGGTGGTGGGYLYNRPIGSSAAVGRMLAYVNGSTRTWANSSRRSIPTMGVNQIDMYSSVPNTTTLEIHNEGFVLPKGM